ncbi:MAG: exodeoxyribonuclease VII large subunit [Cellulomonadaceae bacterium]|jgi:exodeoxyribonuclease VII large subunit|nr:exodeoxyribonuclease VII large subunit [Cellulomonadaceae bacterium]
MTTKPPQAAPGKSAETALSVAQLAAGMKGWIDQLGEVWVEGELLQVNIRPGSGAHFLTLKDQDPTVKSSISVTVWDNVLKASPLELTEGAHVIIHAKADYFTGSGRLSFIARSVRPVGIGALLAEIERRKQVLGAEGLFDESRKKPLPFMPNLVGLVTGRNSDALHDVVRNAQLRWPAVRFEIREVAVQGDRCVPEVKAALSELDGLDAVDVIVIARGGGGAQDLLPFSDESLVRAVAAARTPVVSAIGHEQDRPILDYVADLRASTPTDAAKRIVPDVTEQRQVIATGMERMRAAIRTTIDREQSGLDSVRSRPVLMRPMSLIDGRADEITHALSKARLLMNNRLTVATGEINTLSAQARVLSPATTMDRGYAIVLTATGSVARSKADAPPGSKLLIRLSEGALTATVDGKRTPSASSGTTSGAAIMSASDLKKPSNPPQPKPPSTSDTKTTTTPKEKS